VEFAWSDDDARYRRELRAFLEAALPPDWDAIAAEGPGSEGVVARCRAFCAELARRGWLVQHWPRAWGGADAPPWRHAILGEELWSRGEPRGPQYMNVNWIGPTLLAFGSEPQQREHLPRIARGDVLWCQGFSEPEAGSDLAALRTLAIREGDAYRVNGSKLWTSYANVAEFCFLLVRTDPASQRQRGLSVLLAPMDLPGIEVREVPSVVGDRYFHEVFWSDVRVPASCRLGPEHEGWSVVTYALQYERVGAPRYARAARTLDGLAALAGRQGLLEDPAVLEKLGAARALAEAARLLSYRVIDGRAHGRPPGAETNVARVAGTLAERSVAELALELFGADSLAHGSFGDAQFRMAMTAGVAVGATEVQLNLVAQRGLGLPRE
jgi:alkylation response protein AidB-like acyl-CoA dehydrogenase